MRVWSSNWTCGLRLVCVAVVWVASLSAIAQPSPLIGNVDYFDDFAVTSADNVPAGPTNPRPDRFFGNNTNGAYNVKVNNLANGAIFRPSPGGDSYGVFSFNTPATQNDPRPGNASGNPGGANGFSQSGGNDNVVVYGARDHYVVAVDAILPNDRLDISSGTAEGQGIFTPGSISVFFRHSPAGAAGGTSIDIFKPDPGAPNGLIQTAAPVGHTITNQDQNWHNYAVEFDRAGNRLKTYVDNVLLNDLDLLSFANGVYANFSNSSVGFGSSNVGPPAFEAYVDNFTVGTPVVPEPAALTLLALATPLLLGRRRISGC
jgi:hypothetical protein